jgi:hypothetical protein
MDLGHEGLTPSHSPLHLALCTAFPLDVIWVFPDGIITWPAPIRCCTALACPGIAPQAASTLG